MKTSTPTQTELIIETFRIHFLLVFLSNTKGFGATSGLKFLPIRRFDEYDEIYPALITIIARQNHFEFKDSPECLTFGSWLVRVSICTYN